MVSMRSIAWSKRPQWRSFRYRRSNPGNLGNFSAVGGFRELTNLSIFDLFGFGAADILSLIHICIPISGDLKSKVKQLMEYAGWQEGRKVDISIAERCV